MRGIESQRSRRGLLLAECAAVSIHLRNVRLMCGALTSLALAPACGSSPPVGASTTNPGDASAPSGDASPGAQRDSATAPTEAGAGGDGSTAPDATSDAGSDGMANVYPAFAPDVPQVVNQGGTVLKDPVIVTVTWASDPNASYFEAFGDGLGGTMYWSSIETGYGVGKATSGPTNHVSLETAAPSSMSDGDVVALITANAGVPGSGWPAATPNTMYVVYLPPGTQLLIGGQDLCQSVGGYHESFLLGSQYVAYAAVPQCEGGTGTVTLAASHEIGEGSADPYPSLAPAFVGFDQPHFAWDVFQEFQDEIGDACEFYASSLFMDTEPGFSFTVQRLWSNQSALAGHNPCLPSDTPVYFNTTLIAPESITVDMHQNQGASNYPTKGIHILQGQTRTFPIGLFSDGPTGGPWTIAAHDGNPVVPTTTTGSHLTISLDKTMGQNGDVANVTVTVNSVGPMNSELLTIESRLGVSPRHWLPILIGSQ
jgi:hypothetical protein